MSEDTPEARLAALNGAIAAPREAKSTDTQGFSYARSNRKPRLLPSAPDHSAASRAAPTISWLLSSLLPLGVQVALE